MQHVFLLLSPVEVYTADLTLVFYCLKRRSCYCLWIGPWDEPPNPGSGWLGGSERPKYRSPQSLGHWFQSSSGLGVRMSHRL